MDVASAATEAEPNLRNFRVASKTIEFLLDDARGLYKAEHDRAGQAFPRAGVYLGVCGIYLTALARFIDKPPQATGFADTGFRVCAVLLVLLMIAAVALIASAIIGPTLDFAVRSSVRIKHTRDLATYFQAGPAVPFLEPPALERESLEDKIHNELQHDVLLELSAANEALVAKNEKNYNRLYAASLAIVGGLVLLILTTIFYAYLMMAGPKQEAEVTSVRIVAPVSIARGVESDVMTKDPVARPPSSAPSPKEAVSPPGRPQRPNHEVRKSEDPTHQIPTRPARPNPERR